MAKHKLIVNMRNHFEDKNIFPYLEKIVAKTVENKQALSTAKAVAEIREATGIAVTGPALREMVKRFGPAYHLRKDTLLGRLARVKKGRPCGRAGKPINA